MTFYSSFCGTSVEIHFVNSFFKFFLSYICLYNFVYTKVIFLLLTESQTSLLLIRYFRYLAKNAFL